MNTPEQNKKNLLALKEFFTELIFTLSISWIAIWLMPDVKFYWVSLVISLLALHLLRKFRLSLSSLYRLCAVALFVAIIITILV